MVAHWEMGPKTLTKWCSIGAGRGQKTLQYVADWRLGPKTLSDGLLVQAQLKKKYGTGSELWKPHPPSLLSNRIQSQWPHTMSVSKLLPYEEATILLAE